MSGGIKRWGRRHGLPAGVALLCALLLAAVPAFACAPTTKAKAEPARGEAGSVTMVHGTGFNSSAGPVSIYWGGVGGVLLASDVPVDAAGNFSRQVTIPSSARSGQYYMQTRQANGTSANFPFEVASAEAGEPVPPGRDAPRDSRSDLPQGHYEPAATGPEAPAAQQREARQPASGQPAQPQQQPQAQPATGGGQMATGVAPRASQRSGQASSVAAPSGGGDELAPVEQRELALAGVGAAERRLLAEGVRPERTAAAPPAEAGVIAPAPLTSDLGGPTSVPVGPSPWLLVPLAAVGIGLLLVGTAMFAHEVRQRRVKVPGE